MAKIGQPIARRIKCLPLYTQVCKSTVDVKRSSTGTNISGSHNFWLLMPLKGSCVNVFFKNKTERITQFFYKLTMMNLLQ